jgi:hypothetical protein
MSGENFISIRQRSDEMFEVIVKRTNANAVTLEAENASHAARIAGSLALLVRNQEPKSALILDTHVPERESARRIPAG